MARFDSSPIVIVLFYLVSPDFVTIEDIAPVSIRTPITSNYYAETISFIYYSNISRIRKITLMFEKQKPYFWMD